jgi:L-threonylcarbamoyladenylate synthase
MIKYPVEKSDIKKAAKVIKKGGLVVFPSDTVYILAVDPTSQGAVDKLLRFKNRWTGKAISIAVSDKKMAEEYVTLSNSASNIYANLLPGPFTVVSAGKHKVATGIEAENGTLGIRIPDNKNIKDLVTLVGGPVTATSANLSGRTANYSVASFLKPLSKIKLEMIDMIVDGGKLPKNKPSTVIDATEPEIKILRRGDLITGSSQTLVSRSEKETGKIAEFLLKKVIDKNIDKPIVLGLSGELGCGKTVFSRNIGKLLGVKDKITSPTFVIFNEYRLTGEKWKKFLHFDLYRLGNEYEYEEIKFIEQFTPPAGGQSISCIEWPENMGVKNLTKLKKLTNYFPVNFKYLGKITREIKWQK